MFFGLFKRRNDRNIFRYWDGRQERAADPLRLYFALWSDVDSFHPAKDLAEMAAVIDSENPEDISASEPIVSHVCDKIREVFTITEFEPETGEGLTIEEQLSVFGSFVVFMDAVKKKQDPLRKQWQHSGSNASDQTGTKAPLRALVGQADISADELDQLAEEWKEAVSPSSSETANEASNESSEAKTESESQPQPEGKSPTPLDSDLCSTKPESTPAAPLSSSKQLLELSTPRR